MLNIFKYDLFNDLAFPPINWCCFGRPSDTASAFVISLCYTLIFRIFAYVLCARTRHCHSFKKKKNTTLQFIFIIHFFHLAHIRRNSPTAKWSHLLSLHQPVHALQCSSIISKFLSTTQNTYSTCLFIVSCGVVKKYWCIASMFACFSFCLSS